MTAPKNLFADTLAQFWDPDAYRTVLAAEEEKRAGLRQGRRRPRGWRAEERRHPHGRLPVRARRNRPLLRSIN